jgi:xanthine dehydrogenase/oxidase
VAYPEARLVAGNTEVGIEMKFKDAGYKVLVAPQAVPELNQVRGVSGARCSC